MLVTDNGIIILFKPVQPLKAASPIAVMLLFIVTRVIPVLSLQIPTGIIPT